MIHDLNVKRWMKIIEKLVKNIILWWIVFFIIPFFTIVFYMTGSRLAFLVDICAFFILLLLSEHMHNYLRRKIK